MAMLQLVPDELPQEHEDLFPDFWLLYPRKQAKKDARLAWDRIPYTRHVEILTALVEWRRVWIARGEMEFVPYPATWLNGERWEDELPQTNRPTAAAHVRFERSEPPAKGEMPEHVRTYLAKLKAQKR